MTYATTKTFTLGPQEPPEDYRIFNRRLPDGTRRPVSEFFDRAATVECPDCKERADYKPTGPGYFEIDCPKCGYYEFGCNAK